VNYVPYQLRFELYNPMENIPWIPDADEAYDISAYVLRIESPPTAPHDYRVGDLVRYTANPNNLYEVHPDGMMIGASGLHGEPQPASVTSHPTWNRYAHIGWPRGVDWPPGLTKAEIDMKRLTISLWKPLAGNAVVVPLTPGKVEMVNGVKRICVDKVTNIQYVKTYPRLSGPGPGGTYADYIGIYRRWDPMNANVYGTAGSDDQSNVLWGPGWNMSNYPTLGRPNTNYRAGASTTPSPGSGTSPYKYDRRFERNFKVVDGDLPSIGWLGELMMRNCAQDGPLTWVHTQGQKPTWDTNVDSWSQTANLLDVKAKFDLMRPFAPVGKYNPSTAEMNPVNLHVLDVFTVWDPSNDGIDNDGDGAVDDDDTGQQPGDKCGPEVRVFGKLDLNSISPHLIGLVFPDQRDYRDVAHDYRFVALMEADIFGTKRTLNRGTWDNREGLGPFETIGDLLRCDKLTALPASRLCIRSRINYNAPPWEESGPLPGDDDEDGILEERDERDLIFTWISNYLTTRGSVFEADLTAEICDPPYYPGPPYLPAVKLPYHAYKSKSSYARKRMLALLDRSTALRVNNADGSCDFTGPITVRMLRTTDDLIVH
jgi:hypothetical protein